MNMTIFTELDTDTKVEIEFSAWIERDHECGWEIESLYIQDTQIDQWMLSDKANYIIDQAVDQWCEDNYSEIELECEIARADAIYDSMQEEGGL